MNLRGNTVFITGGGSGIGRGLAEELHRLGNQVIISGRRKAMLSETTEANPGMRSVELDVEDPASIAAVAGQLITEYPALNMLINNAGIMRDDDVSGAHDDAQMMATVTTNLLGPIRLTAALLDHLKSQETAAVINVTSGLAFVPLATSAVYSATKAAIHSYTQALRYQLRATRVHVRELVPPYVQTDLLHGKDDPNAMPLEAYIKETMELMATDSDELLVERVKPLRCAVGVEEKRFMYQMNDARQKV